MVNDIKYIIKKILIGVGIALILMLLKNGLILKTYALENVYPIAPTSSTYYRSDGSSASQAITRFVPTGYTGLQFNGLVSSSTSGTWTQARYVLNISSIPKGYYDLSYLFYTNWNGSLLDSYTFTFYYAGNNYVCSGNASNAVNVTGGTTIKHVLGVKCEDVYLDPTTNTGLNINIITYSSANLGNTLGITDVVFQYSSINSNNEIVDEQKKTNETLTDDSVDNDKASSDLSTMNGKVASNGSISSLLTLPITMYQSILNSASGSCSPVNLGSLYGHSLSLPCIDLSNLLGSTLYNIIDILCCGLFILSFRKKMVDIFNHMTSLNDRGNELE